jgi:hypothetical protein
MGRHARTSPDATSPASTARPAADYRHELAKLRRFRAAMQRTVSETEDYVAHSDERRTKAREPEPVD